MAIDFLYIERITPGKLIRRIPRSFLNIIFFFFSVGSLNANTPQIAKPTLGPLTTIPVADYKKLPDSAQVMYIAGILDGMTFTTYGYSVADHDGFVKCMRTMKLGEIRDKVTKFLDENKNFKEGVASATAHVAGSTCKAFRSQKK